MLSAPDDSAWVKYTIGFDLDNSKFVFRILCNHKVSEMHSIIIIHQAEKVNIGVLWMMV